MTIIVMEINKTIIVSVQKMKDRRCYCSVSNVGQNVNADDNEQ